MAAAPKIFSCELNFYFYLTSTGKICLEKPAGEMWSVVDWSSGTWSDSDTWSEGVIDSSDRLPSNLWTSEKMRVIAQFEGEFQGCFVPTEECQGGFCPRPWWKACSSLSQPLLVPFSSMLPSPGLLIIPSLTNCQLLSCLSFTQPSLLVLGSVSAAPQRTEPVAWLQS